MPRTRRRRRSPRSLVALVGVVVTSISSVVVHWRINGCCWASIVVAEEENLPLTVECHADGTCQPTQQSTTTTMECGLYMAESSIPHAGWGIYTGRELRQGDHLDIFEIVIPHIDELEQQEQQQKIYNVTVPESLLTEYAWTNQKNHPFEARSSKSIVPGLGMLPNCHLGLVNLQQLACTDRSDAPRTSPTAGASTHFHDCAFVVTPPVVPAGHELFDMYGDKWFTEGRSSMFGNDFPLTQDFQRANELVQLWQTKIDHTADADADDSTVQQSNAIWNKFFGRNQKHKVSVQNHELAEDLWKLVAQNPLLSPRTQRVMPNDPPPPTTTSSSSTSNVAYNTVPNVIRSLDWLQTHGWCLDHIRVQPLPDRYQERGVVARRFLPRGTVVAPAPMVHMSRKHVEYLYTDTDHVVLWKGQQLLLNYCFGHVESSLLLIPTSPMVSMINHYNQSRGERPNVALRWSSASHYHRADWFQLTPEQLVAVDDDNELVNSSNSSTHYSGLLAEFYALTDIAPGDPLLLDYGDAWQAAWDRHTEHWQRLLADDAIVHAEDYVSASDYEKSKCRDPNDTSSKTEHEDCLFHPPSWIQTRCFLHPFDKLDDGVEWINWKSPLDGQGKKRNVYDGLHDQSNECQVLSRGPGTTYRVHFSPKTGRGDGSNYLKVQNVPRSAIILVDRPYTGNQHLRYAFRHEIQLPDDMVPLAWRDLVTHQQDDCGLYMAESAIPHSGLGMYTAQPVSEGERISYGGLVVQAEDVDLNVKLRRWFHKDFNYAEDHWLLHMYYWDPSVSMGQFEANEVQSIIPGLGMLANSHTGLVNAEIRAPQRSTSNLQRGRDPGAGASTTFHDNLFVAGTNIEAGAELYVAYGDDWFAERIELGDIPLSDDFKFADQLLQKLEKILAKKSNNEELIVDSLELVRNITSSRPRLRYSIPSSYTDYLAALQKGSASLTVPNRVRSIEWLQQNGRCLDNLQPDQSTIRDAGRGAFATRHIRKGQVIAPMPVVHLRRRHMEVYNGDDLDDPQASLWREGTQLLINYCFSHPESSLLLFPYAPAVQYVNHHSNASNAELRWSDLPNHHRDWLNRTPDDLDSEDHAGLILELVATEDIAAGAEVFLNYGPEWQNAWEAYVQQWKPAEPRRRPVSAAELNERLEWIRTNNDADPLYPIPNKDDIFLVCFVAGLTERQVLKEDDESITYQWMNDEKLFATDRFAHPCQVLERMDATAAIRNNNSSQEVFLDLDHAYDRKDSVLPFKLKYRILLDLDEDDEDDDDDSRRRVLVEGVPRRAIQMFDKAYRSESFDRAAFRHEMRLPDHMVSEAWRDLERLEQIRLKKAKTKPL